MKERTLYALLAMVFAVSRLGYYLLGVRFDARPVLNYYQFIDPELLKHRLFESLLYLHIQPPGWNLYVGTVLKLFPTSYPSAFHVCHLLMGLGICWSLYYLVRTCRVSRWLAFSLAVWFIVSPGVVLFENYLLYEYLVAFLLLMAAVALARFLQDARARWMILFFAALFGLVLVRNFFHLVYFIAMLAALAFLSKSHRRMVLLCGAVPLLAIVGLYAKNRILFGTFSGSTWMGMNMDVITAHQLTPDEARYFVSRGVISGASLLDSGSALDLYRPYIQMPGRTGIPVLDDCITSTGATNFNCLAFLQVQQIYTRDGLALLRNYPVVYLRSMEVAWFSYFLPPGDFPFFDLNRPRIHKLDRVWNFVFFGQFKEASDRKELRRLAAHGARASLVLFTGIFLMIGLPALWLWGLYYVVSGVRNKTMDRPQAMLIGFLLANIAYVTAIANLLSSFENNRYRFPLDAFYVVLLGIALSSSLGSKIPHDKGRSPFVKLLRMRLSTVSASTASKSVAKANARLRSGIATRYPLGNKRSS
jgi:hypothetical protein